jgi:lipooligosaccharide transport system permease protein
VSIDQTPRVGALKLVDVQNVARWGAFYVAEYRIRHMFKWWTAILAFGLGNPVLYLVSIGLGIGALVDANVGSQGVNGVSYLLFLAPALLASAAIQSGMDEVTFPVLAGFIWEKYFYAMNATAITGKQITHGVQIAAFARTVFSVILYWLVLLIAGVVDFVSIFTLVPSAIFAGTAFASLMLAVAAYVKDDDGYFALIGRFVIAPMFLFSGTFYPLELMPIGLQVVGWISPLWHATEIGRQFTYGTNMGAATMLMHFGYLTLLFLVGAYFGARKITARLAA